MAFQAPSKNSSESAGASPSSEVAASRSSAAAQGRPRLGCLVAGDGARPKGTAPSRLRATIGVSPLRSNADSALVRSTRPSTAYDSFGSVGFVPPPDTAPADAAEDSGCLRRSDFAGAPPNARRSPRPLRAAGIALARSGERMRAALRRAPRRPRAQHEGRRGACRRERPRWRVDRWLARNAGIAGSPSNTRVEGSVDRGSDGSRSGKSRDRCNAADGITAGVVRSAVEKAACGPFRAARRAIARSEAFGLAWILPESACPVRSTSPPSQSPC